MKQVIFSIIFLVIAFFMIDYSFGYQPEINEDLFIFVQTSVRNSDGQLVVYLESSKFTYVNNEALNLFLDFEASRGTDPIVTIDEQNFQIIRRVQTQSINSDGLVPSTILSDNVNGEQIVLARFAHDGYPVTSGDTIESMWTFIRLVS